MQSHKRPYMTLFQFPSERFSICSVFFSNKQASKQQNNKTLFMKFYRTFSEFYIEQVNSNEKKYIRWLIWVHNLNSLKRISK